MLLSLSSLGEIDNGVFVGTAPFGWKRSKRPQTRALLPLLSAESGKPKREREKLSQPSKESVGLAFRCIRPYLMTGQNE